MPSGTRKEPGWPRVNFVETTAPIESQMSHAPPKKYDCHVPWFYTGNHTQQNKSLAICSNEKILNVLERYETLTKSCKLVMPCQHARYHMLSKSFKYISFGVSITFLTPCLESKSYPTLVLGLNKTKRL